MITDVIFLPVESSETRVTADVETYKLIAGIFLVKQTIQIGFQR